MPAPSSYPSGTTLLLVSTKRGLFLVSSPDREQWTVADPILEGKVVYNATLDQRGGASRLFATDNNTFFGSKLLYSDDLGANWHEPERGIQFSEESGLALQNLWLIEPGRAEEPGTLYVGIDPATLWVTHDRGITWEPNAGLLHHPTRERWNPGAGGLCLHSIVPDYSNPRRMWVGISAVGCMRTDDGGETWVFANRGTRAEFQPERFPEFGQCLHRLIQHPTQPDTLYQQNHCGVYRSADAGESWTDITPGLPGDFGFPIALDAHNPETIYVVSEEGWGRHNYGDQFTVYRSQNAGDTWEPLTEGLPGGPNVRLGVLRHGMCADTFDPCGIYVGTNTGQLFASTNRGDSWKMVADFLPSINAVNVVSIA